MSKFVATAYSADPADGPRNGVSSLEWDTSAQAIYQVVAKVGLRFSISSIEVKEVVEEEPKLDREAITSLLRRIKLANEELQYKATLIEQLAHDIQRELNNGR